LAVDGVSFGCKTVTSVVFGGSGLVGGYIVDRLARAGEPVVAISRRPRQTPGADWIIGNLADPAGLRLPDAGVIYCTVSSLLFADALPRLITPGLRRVVVFSSTSVVTKQDSSDDIDRDTARRYQSIEQRVSAVCDGAGVGWTILRPTLIYAEGRDQNVTRLAGIIRRFGFMPVIGRARGLRQPVHAEDLATAAVACASSPRAVNRTYELSGGDTISYHEMVGRIFDGLDKRRRIVPLPAALWAAAFAIAKPLFPGVSLAMGLRMRKDMAFDHSAASADLGWTPRGFRPDFRRQGE
jgi:nucleoside-diphosphate-sugar epimerase